ncbi:MAG TPA: glycosyltransferase family 2 protein [Bacteroidales bacterium]|nr:glycosyltransferase family 2 protein [Bacteroidales bacterium]
MITKLNNNISVPLGVVIVSYKTTAKTIQFIKNELTKIKTLKKIVVVNNSFSAQDEHEFAVSLDACIISVNKTIDKEKNVFILNSEENLGFAKGNNLGAEFLISNFHPQYLLFSNNDIEILSEDVVEKLIAKIETNPQIGIIGPKMIDQNGASISPRYDRVGPLRYSLWHIFFPIRQSQILSKFNWLSPGIQEFKKRKNEQEGYCYWVVGSFMLLNTDIFIRIEGFDAGTFLYSEEKILTEKLHATGYKMYFYPSVSVLSIGEYTTSKYLQNIEKKKLIFDSDLYYYKKYFKINILLLGMLYLARFLYLSIYCRFYKK